MALDMLVDSTQLDSDLTSIANAIRTKGGTSEQLLFPGGFVSAVAQLPSARVKHYIVEKQNFGEDGVITVNSELLNSLKTDYPEAYMLSSIPLHAEWNDSERLAWEFYGEATMNHVNAMYGAFSNDGTNIEAISFKIDDAFLLFAISNNTGTPDLTGDGNGIGTGSASVLVDTDNTIAIWYEDGDFTNLPVLVAPEE